MDVAISFVAPSTSSEALLTIKGELTVYTVSDAKTLLLPWAKQAPSDTALDVAAVTDMDTAGLQLLLKVRQHCVRSGKQLTLVAASHAVTAVLNSLHLTELTCSEVRV